MSSMNATYSPEDNKLRLYSMSRLSADDYAAVKAAGFKWAPKQELFVSPGWSPDREDLLLEMCGEIGDEDYFPEERAADRAERFEDYRDKRAAEAGASADQFESGPPAFGHQSRARAERQAVRHDRTRVYAVCQWRKAEYWQRRTAGVISHALHRSSAAVRRGRILRLEAEQRKHEKSRAEYAERFEQWQRVPTLDGADKPVVCADSDSFCGIDIDASGPAASLAYTLANSGGCWGEYVHPRTGRKSSLYSLLTDAADPITAREAAALWLADRIDPADPESHSARWSAHYELRLNYEKAMLAEEGGTAAEADIEPGGFIRLRSRRTDGPCCGKYDAEPGEQQIVTVHKSPATGRVTSVKVWGWDNHWGNAERTRCLVNVNIERLGEDAYRPPTDEERAAFEVDQADRKAAAKATKPKAPPLVNPTDEDAERLQQLWNDAAKARYEQAEIKRYGKVYGDFKPSTVRRMTQEQYSAASGGSYSHCETLEIAENGFPHPGRWDSSAPKFPTAFKVRRSYAGTNCSASPYRIIVITDKPQKPLPLDWASVVSSAMESEAVR